MNNHYKTIILSDLHLGIKASKAKEVVRFLKKNTCDTLILNGDIIDGWALRRSGKWKKKHTKFFKLILNYVSKRKSKVIYIRGNHDDFLDEILPFELGNFSIKKYHIHESGEKKYFVTHGDLFDTVTSKMKWIAKLGDVGYTFLLWINRHYNSYREKRGLPYYSMSQAVKSKVKTAVSFVGDYENQLASVAESKNCQGIICGHIHQPANKMIGDIHYLNSGDWVETLSALVENGRGEWEIIYFSEWEKSKVKQETKTESLSQEIEAIDRQIKQLKTAF
ncbi:MAG: UDP-2,3-diacylglucosamine diphosphatase [Bacteroidota bacterium]|jgi:UDP-2,3-diacylglucosamine pyrophosphatase LpxH